jgi:hypothetical protein
MAGVAGVRHDRDVNSGAVSAVVAVAGLAFVIVALFVQARVSRRGVSMQVYRDTAVAWETRSKAQDAQMADCHAQIADLREALAKRDSFIAELRGKVDVMQELLTGRASWEVLEERTTELVTMLRSVRSEVRHLRRAAAADDDNDGEGGR